MKKVWQVSGTHGLEIRWWVSGFHSATGSGISYGASYGPFRHLWRALLLAWWLNLRGVRPMNRRGFSIVELLVAVIVIGILAVLVASPRRPAEVYQPTTLTEQRDSIVALEARRAGVPVDIALAVSHVENWSGDSTAVSPAGAVGIMQVMPKYWQHSFEEECGCGSLTQRHRNACVGVRILDQYYTRYKTWGKTVRAYHGSHASHAGQQYADAVLERLAAIRLVVEQP